MQHVLRKSLFFITTAGISYASYLLFVSTLPYLTFSPTVDFLVTKQLIYHIKSWRWSFYIHILTAGLTLLPGLIQFIPFILRNFPRFHRINGYIYLSGVLLLAGPSGLIMSFYANGGFLSKLSFILLSLLWLTSTWLALRAILKGNIEQHFNWITRSYALTLSAVTLRFYAYLMDVFHLHWNPTEEYTLLAWGSWLPNLLLAELLIRKKTRALFSKKTTRYSQAK